MLSTILLQATAVMDTGSTGFMLLATSLVMLMTPALAMFYGTFLRL
jgi:Amt family ammonium transporter